MDFANKIQIEDTIMQKRLISQFWFTQGLIILVILFLGFKKAILLLAYEGIHSFLIYLSSWQWLI